MFGKQTLSQSARLTIYYNATFPRSIPLDPQLATFEVEKQPFHALTLRPKLNPPEP
jgi:hypothetical protein